MRRGEGIHTVVYFMIYYVVISYVGIIVTAGALVSHSTLSNAWKSLHQKVWTERLHTRYEI